jgi:hypothetical protein
MLKELPQGPRFPKCHPLNIIERCFAHVWSFVNLGNTLLVGDAQLPQELNSAWRCGR